MSDKPRTRPDLPANHGQFGENNATEAHNPLPKGDGPAPARRPRNSDGGEVTDP